MKLFALACTAGALALITSSATAQVKPGIMERFGAPAERTRPEKQRPAPARSPAADEELQGRLLKLIERHDLDKDGKLNASEAKAAREAWAKLRALHGEQKPERGARGAREDSAKGRKGPRTPGDRAGRDGTKRPKQGSPLHKALLERFDANGNGQLDGPEAAKARSHWARMRAEQKPEQKPGRNPDDRTRGRRPQVDPRRAEKRARPGDQRRPQAKGQGPKVRSPRRPAGARKPSSAAQPKRAPIRRVHRR